MPILALCWQYRRLIGIVVLIVSVTVLVTYELRQMKHRAYDAGVHAERDRVIKVIKAENVRNRAFEAKLGEQVIRYGSKLDQSQRERIVRETVYRDRMVKLIDASPNSNCPTDPKVTELRNAIRISQN